MKIRWLILVFAFFGTLRGVAQSPTRNFYEIQREMEAYFASRDHHDAGEDEDEEEDDADGYNLFKRAEYYAQTRLDRQGNLVNTSKRKMNALKKYHPPHAEALQRSYSGGWEFFGPYMYSDYGGIGRVSRIAFHPTDENTIYAATAGGGLWYTTTHGALWTPLTESLPVNNLNGVAIDYTDPDIIYILTGDGDGHSGSARKNYGLQKASIGVLKSTDGGATWKQTGLAFDEADLIWPYDLKIHPSNPQILYACTNDGLYRTINGGDDWYKILDDLVFQLEFKPDNPNTIFVVGATNFYRSTSSGFAWNDTIPIPLFDDRDGRMTIAPSASEPNTIYLAAAPGSDSLGTYRGLFRSIDGGQSFDMVIDTPDVAENQSSYDFTIVCDPNDLNNVMIGSVHLWRSNSGGTEMTTIGGTHSDIHQLITNPLNNRCYAATDGGLYYSDDFGDSWTYMSDFLAISQYYKIAVSQQDPNIVIGGAQDNGTQRNTNVVTTVMDKIYGKDGMDCAIHPLKDSLMIFSAQKGEFAISHDRGETSDSLISLSSLPEDVEAIWLTPVAWDPNDTNRIFIGYKPIYFSTDCGNTFNPIPDTISGRRILHIAPANSQRMYAGDLYSAVDGTKPFHLWTSEDGGSSWARVDTSQTYPDTLMIVSSLITNPQDADEVWITLAGWEGGEKVYSSTDAGATWTNRSGTLPNVPVNAIVYENTEGTYDYSVYIGTDIGVFYTNSDLGDWVPFSNDLPIVEVADLEINTSDGKLLAGTYGRGIWISDLFSTCESDLYLTMLQQSPDHTYYFQASDSIISALEIDGFGVSVLYRAGNVVSLQEGFHATAANGAMFWAKNAGCTGGIDYPLVVNPSVPVPASDESLSPDKPDDPLQGEPVRMMSQQKD